MAVRKRAETTLNIFSYVFAVVATVGLLRLAAAHWADISPLGSNALKGASLAAVAPDEHWPIDRPAIVLLLRSTCPYCQASVPFHRQLVKHAAQRGLRVIVLTNEPVWQMTTPPSYESLES